MITQARSVFGEFATLKSFKTQDTVAGIQSDFPGVHCTAADDCVEIMTIRFFQAFNCYDHRVESNPSIFPLTRACSRTSKVLPPGAISYGFASGKRRCRNRAFGSFPAISLS